MKLKMIPVLIVGLALACALSSTASADVTSSSSTPAIPLRVALSATGLLFPDLNVWHRVKDWDAFDKASNGILAIKAWESGGGNNAKKLTGDDVVNFVENACSQCIVGGVVREVNKRPRPWHHFGRAV